MDDFANFSPKKSDDEWLAEADAVLRSCRGKSDAEIARRIYARAAEGKRAGTLTNEQIESFWERFSPMLDGAAKKRLRKLVEELKRM